MRQGLGYPPPGTVVYNSYWKEHYTVVGHNENGTVTVLWHGRDEVNHADKREATHRTPFEEKWNTIVSCPETEAEFA